jgi:uncharacterized protein YjgD (DUF1641 family)
MPESSRDDAILAALERLERRLDHMERRLDDLHLPETAAMAVDALDDQVARLNARGVDVHGRLLAAGEALERLSEPAVLDALSRLGARAGELSTVVEVASAAEPFAAMTTDAVDAWAADVAARGAPVHERVAALGATLEVLSDPGTAAALARVAQHAVALEPLLEIATRWEALVAMGADVADDAVGDLVQRGVDPTARVTVALRALERLTDPAAADALDRLTEPGALIAASDAIATVQQMKTLLDLASRTDEIVGMAFDVADGIAADMVKAGVDPLDRLNDLLVLARQVTDRKVLDAVGRAAEQSWALDEVVTALTTPAQPVGLWGLMSSMSDPEVQRGVGVALSLARRLGGLSTSASRRPE